MASAKTFVLVGLLNVVIIETCFCSDFFCDIFPGIYNIIILLLVYHVLSKPFFSLAKIDSIVRGLLKCYETKADYRITFPPSRFTEYYVKLNCSSTGSEEV